MHKPRKIYFDTNFFLNIVEGEIPRPLLNVFIELCNKYEIELYYSPINFLELVSHINAEEKTKFTYYKKAFAIIKEICNGNILPHPDLALQQILGSEASDELKDEYRLIRYLDNIIDAILKADTFDDIVNKSIVHDDETEYTFTDTGSKELRSLNEETYINDMYEITNLINPTYAKKLRKNKTPKITDQKILREYKEFLDSDKSKQAFLDGCYQVVNPEIADQGLLPMSKQEVDKLISRLSADFYCKKTILMRIATDGYNTTKNKNDFHDRKFLIYLGLNDEYYFVCYDERLKEKIIESPQSTRVLKLPEIISIIKEIYQ